MKIGFIGQGYVGKNYADDFEKRGFDIVRYSLEEAYKNNKKEVGECDIVFIAVPTPTTPMGFDGSIVEQALTNIQPGKIAVIKSTILPGMTQSLQEKFPHLTILFSPEFLREATAAYDAAHPHAVIVGMPVADEKHSRAAAQVLEILPAAGSKQICTSTEAELTKYTQNIVGYVEILTFNLLYDVAQKLGADWQAVREGLKADPNISMHFTNPVHKGGRGAGGSCLVKDLAAMRELYNKLMPDDVAGNALFRALEQKNIALLTASQKSLDIVKMVYGIEEPHT